MIWLVLHQGFITATCLLLSGCSLFFEPANDRPGGNGHGDPAELCLGIERIYDLGEELAPLQYEHLDFAQGTVTFWARALQLPVEGDQLLIDLGGLRVSTNAAGDALVEIPGAPAQSFPAAIEWQEEEQAKDVFLALRWDSKRPVSGSQFPPAFIMLRVGESQRNYGTNSSFNVGPIESTAMKVGGGAFHVDQLVVYDRPLFVSDSVDEGEPDQLRDLGRKKSASARLVGGSHEVSFATSAPPFTECSDYKALAWSNSPSLSRVPGSIRAGNSTGWDVPPVIQMPESERVFSSGFAVADAPASFRDRFTSNVSYHFYALVHGQGDAIPLLRISALNAAGGAEELIRMIASEASLEEPQVLSGTFTVPSDATTVEFSLERADSGSSDLAIFHTLIVRENMLDNSSFEIPGPNLPEDLPGPWQQRSEDKLGARRSEETHTANGGHFSICFEGSGFPNDLTQTISGDLDNEHFYAMGASFFWFPGASVTPGVTGGNSAFFATSAPTDGANTARSEAGIGAQGRWEATGTVGYRLYGEGFESSNDAVFFGSLGSEPSDEVDFCVDDAFFYDMPVITGTTSP